MWKYIKCRAAAMERPWGFPEVWNRVTSPCVGTRQSFPGSVRSTSTNDEADFTTRISPVSLGGAVDSTRSKQLVAIKPCFVDNKTRRMGAHVCLPSQQSRLWCLAAKMELPPRRPCRELPASLFHDIDVDSREIAARHRSSAPEKPKTPDLQTSGRFLGRQSFSDTRKLFTGTVLLHRCTPYFLKQP